MTSEGWDPFREAVSVRDSMERFLREGFARFGSVLSVVEPSYLPVDVADGGDRYVVRASLPGVLPERVEVTVQGSLLTIRAEALAEEERAGQQWLTRERRAGVVQRSLTLPAAVDSERAQAHFEHGVLELTLPKAEVTPPRLLPISATTGARGMVGVSTTGTSASPPAHLARMPEVPAADQAGAEEPRRETHDDRVTAESDESFPASDPPSWTPERA
jgi:HSP20 family protein